MKFSKWILVFTSLCFLFPAYSYPSQRGVPEGSRNSILYNTLCGDYNLLSNSQKIKIHKVYLGEVMDRVSKLKDSFSESLLAEENIVNFLAKSCEESSQKNLDYVSKENSLYLSKSIRDLLFQQNKEKFRDNR